MDEIGDDALLRGFRDARLERFPHRHHVRVARLYLLRWGLLGALERFPRDLSSFAVAKGKPDLYHETVTWAYLMLIHERMAARPEGDRWESFARDNPDLLDWQDNILHRYYREETLQGAEARRRFVFPDAAHAGREARDTVIAGGSGPEVP